MPLHVTKHERRDGADRNEFGKAALNICRVARSREGVRDARFYWAGWDTIGIVINADIGAWGPGSGGGGPVPEVAKATRAMSDLARMVSNETWGDAAVGEQAYLMSNK
jgi:hypothetical protein